MYRRHEDHMFVVVGFPEVHELEQLDSCRLVGRGMPE